MKNWQQWLQVISNHFHLWMTKDSEDLLIHLIQCMQFQECLTRWNSTFHLLKQIVESKESKDAFISTQAVINAPVDPLCQEEWEVHSLFWSHLNGSLWRSVHTGAVYKCYQIIISYY